MICPPDTETWAHATDTFRTHYMPTYRWDMHSVPNYIDQNGLILIDRIEWRYELWSYCCLMQDACHDIINITLFILSIYPCNPIINHQSLVASIRAGSNERVGT
jgi:hypothetical protein